LATLRKAIKALGGDLAIDASNIDIARVNLDAREDTSFLEDLDKGLSR